MCGVFFFPQSTVNSFSLRASIYSDGKMLKHCKGSIWGAGAFTRHEEKPLRAGNLGLKTPPSLFFFFFFFPTLALQRWLCISSTCRDASLLCCKRLKEPSSSQFGGTEGLGFIKKAFHLKEVSERSRSP